LRHHLLFGLFGVLVDAPVMAAKMVVDIKSDVLKSGRELKLTGSTEVRFSCNEMPVDRLLAFFKIGLSGRANQ
jgi:hypothetical protein